MDKDHLRMAIKAPVMFALRSVSDDATSYKGNQTAHVIVLPAAQLALYVSDDISR